MVNGGFGEILSRFELGSPGDPMCVVQDFLETLRSPREAVGALV